MDNLDKNLKHLSLSDQNQQDESSKNIESIALAQHQQQQQQHQRNRNLLKILRILQKKRQESVTDDSGQASAGSVEIEDDDDTFTKRADDDININTSKSMLKTSQDTSAEDEESSSELSSLSRLLFDSDEPDSESTRIRSYEDLPKHLIVTQLPSELFRNENLKTEFQKLFQEIDEKCRFCYLRVMNRCCVQFESGLSAILARFQLEDKTFMNQHLNIILSRPIKLKNTRPLLEPPENDKTFLISPPSSPPIGWEQIYEDPPVVNLDLLSALTKLTPNEPCEIIKSTAENMPSIVIHPCEEAEELFQENDPESKQKRKYIPTKRPAYDTS